jgi:hypothetical protein
MKRLILVFIFLVSFASFAQGPEFELYAGMAVPQPENTNLGYQIGVNLTPNLFQLDKNNPKKYREYLNKWLIGVEFSGYQTKLQSVILDKNQVPITPTEHCNCTSTPIDGINTGGTYITKQDVIAVSLNLGVEIYKGWYVLSGISSYQHRNILNNETLNKYRTTYLDFGLKKYIKIGRSYWSPTFKFNSEVVSFGLGYSFYK